MRALTFILFMGLSVCALAQVGANVTVFSEQGERLWVIVNGVRQNEYAETNIKVTGLTQPNYKFKVIFEDESLGDIDRNIPTMDVDGNYMESTFVVKQNKKGVYVLKVNSFLPIAQAPSPASGQAVVVYTATPKPVANTTVTVTGPTTTIGVENGGTNESVNMNMGVNAGGESVNVGINVDVSDNMGEVYEETTVTTTTVTTTEAMVEEPPAYLVPGYSGPVGCAYPMTSSDFNAAKASIVSKSFEDSKLTIAKQVTDANCLTAQQVKEVMLLFNFEDTRLDYAKHAYGNTYDIGNYYKVNDAFDFESSIEELNGFINSQR